MCGCRHEHVFHFKSQISLTDKAFRALINLADERGINLNAKLLRILKLIVEHCDALADCLIVFNVSYALDEVPDVELSFEAQVKYCSIIHESHINVRPVLPDLVVDAVESNEVECVHGVSQILLGFRNNSETIVAAADRALSDFTVFILKDPVFGRA